MIILSINDKSASKFEPFLGSRGALNFAPHDRYIARLLEIQPKVDHSLLVETMKHILKLHDLLRLRAFKEQSATQLFIADDYLDEPVKWVNLATLSDEEQRCTIKATAIEMYHSLDDYSGYLSRFVYFDRGEQEVGLFFVALHHVIADDYSADILLKNIQNIYLQLKNGKTLDLAAKTASFKEFTMRIKQYLYSDFPNELDYWNSLQAVTTVLPVDYPENKTNVSTQFHTTKVASSIKRIVLSLNDAETNQLLRSVAKLGIRFEDVLLAGLLQAVVTWQAKSGLHVYIINSGRWLFDDINVANTIGYMSTGLWNYFNINKTSSPTELLRSTIEQRSQVPNQGMGLSLAMNYSGYDDPGWFQFYTSEKMIFAKNVYYSDNIIFNYYGRVNNHPSSKSNSFKPAEYIYQDLVNPYKLFNNKQELQEIHRLNSRSFIQSGKLFLIWEYNTLLYQPQTIENLANNNLQSLRSIGALIEYNG